MDTISLIIHVTAAAILVGPQVVMFFAVIPATWFIEDEELKRNVTRTIAGRFGMLAGASIVVLLVTGLYQFYTAVPEEIQGDMMAYRFGTIFIVKMTMVTVLLGLILAHTMIYSRRITRLSDAVLAGEAEPGDVEYARRQSFGFSVFLLLASVITLWLGVTLGHHDYSYVLQ
ncbi:MAG: hypothetical protein WD800_01460 [Dehalococcoidia bacterium]